MNILFLGGDKRYKYMINDLSDTENVSEIGFEILSDNVYKENLDTLDLSKYDVVLLPISGISDNMEIKSEIGAIKLSENIFKNINEDTLFFTGLKTKKILEFIPKDQIISFLDDDEVESINNALTVEGVIDDIRDRKNDIVTILRIWNFRKRTIFKTKAVLE